MAKITKLSDDVFEGKHPNNIHKGFTKQGHIHSPLKVGSSFIIGSFITSRVTKIIEETLTSAKFKTKNSTYLVKFGRKELPADNNRIVSLPLEFRRDFRSVDKQAAISAEGVMFKIGDLVKHEGDEHGLAAAIERFSINSETMDVMAHSSVGVGRISFLYHLEDGVE